MYVKFITIHTMLFFSKKSVSVFFIAFLSRKCWMPLKLTGIVTVNISDYIVLPSGALQRLLQGIRLFAPMLNGLRLCYIFYVWIFLSVLLFSFFHYCQPSQVLTLDLLQVAHPQSAFEIPCFLSAIGFNFIILNTLLILRSFIWHLQFFRAQDKNFKAKQVLEQLRQLQQLP